MNIKSAAHNATVGNTATAKISVTRSKSALKRALSAAGKFALVAGIGCAVGGFTLWHSVEQTASEFRVSNRVVLQTESDALANIQAWKLDILTHGGLGLANGVIASTIAAWVLFQRDDDEEQDPALVQALINQRLNKLVGASNNAAVIEAVATIQAEMSEE